MAKGAFTGVLHCFTGSKRLAEAALDLGFYISASGIITFKKSEALRAVFKDVPLERLLVETDAPYLAPVPHRGKTQRARLRGAHRRRAGRAQRRCGRGAGARHQRKFLPPVHEGRAPAHARRDTTRNHHPGLRLVGRRAAARRRGRRRQLGRLRSGQSEEPPQPLFDPGASGFRRRRDARAGRHLARHARAASGARASSELDGVLITHDHADQLHGIDDLRLVSIHQRRRVDVYTDAHDGEGILSRFSYCFVQPEGSDYPPIAKLHAIAEPFAPFDIGGAGGPVPVLAFAQRHGQRALAGVSLRSAGLFLGRQRAADEDAFAALAGAECWIVDALRYTPHPSHSHVAQTLEWIARVKPKRAILTNLHLDLDYETLKRELPPSVEPAYDGMTIRAGL